MIRFRRVAEGLIPGWGMPRGPDIREKLVEEAFHAQSHKDRRREISGIMKKLARGARFQKAA